MIWGVRYVCALHIPFVFRGDPVEARLQEVHRRAITEMGTDIRELYGDHLSQGTEIEVIVGDKARVMTQIAPPI